MLFDCFNVKHLFTLLWTRINVFCKNISITHFISSYILWVLNVLKKCFNKIRPFGSNQKKKKK